MVGRGRGLRSGGAHAGQALSLRWKWKALGVCIVSLALVPFFVPLAIDGEFSVFRG